MLEYPSTLEYFSPRKRNKNGLHELCRKCRLERDKKYKKENEEMYKKIRKEWTEINREKLDLQNKKYADAHKERKSETNRLWHQINKEKKNIQVKEWALKNKDRRIKTINQWRKDNPKKYNTILKKYRINNKGKRIIWQQIRRSKQNLLPSTLNYIEWQIIKKYFDNKCAYCGIEKFLTQEHFIPVKKMGGYTIENIIPACMRCNSSKSSKDCDQWYLLQEFYNEDRKNKILNRIYN